MTLALVGMVALACNQQSEASPSDEFTPLVVGESPAAKAEWAGRTWRVNAGLAAGRGKGYAIQTAADGSIIRFEVRDTDGDRSIHDSDDTRRAELSGSLYGDDERLPNGMPLWGAFSFRHHAWADPDGMLATTGGVYGQIHMGAEFGGSPALAFRRARDGHFRITTRGQFEPDGNVHFDAPLSFDTVHDLVYRIVLHPTAGSLSVWLDGEQVVAVDRLSIGHESAQSYWAFGLYFSGGIAGPVTAEYAHHTYPAPQSLFGRTSNPPDWPSLDR